MPILTEKDFLRFTKGEINVFIILIGITLGWFQIRKINPTQAAEKVKKTFEAKIKS